MYKKIVDQIYRVPIIIVVGGTQLDAYKIFSDELSPSITTGEIGINGAIAWVYAHEDVDGICIWLGDKTTPSVIAHECLHATNIVLQYRGCKPASEDDDEHYCHYMQWVFEQVYYFWCESKKKSSNEKNTDNN